MLHRFSASDSLSRGSRGCLKGRSVTVRKELGFLRQQNARSLPSRGDGGKNSRNTFDCSCIFYFSKSERKNSVLTSTNFPVPLSQLIMMFTAIGGRQKAAMT